MFCSNCGCKLNDDTKFCPQCGAAAGGEQSPADQRPEPYGYGQTYPPAGRNAHPPVKPAGRAPSEKKMMQEGQYVTPNIVYCQDGKYRWIYELRLFKNPTIFLLVWKIFFFIFLGIFAFVFIADAADGRLKGETALTNLKVFVYVIIGMTVVVSLGMLLYAAIMGGKYCVLFEMDDSGINHKQLASQVKKAQAIAALTVLAGAVAGNMSTMGIGLNAARSEMYSSFDKVTKIKRYPRRDLIKVNCGLFHNQVYAVKEDYGFVSDFISSHIRETAKNK